MKKNYKTLSVLLLSLLVLSFASCSKAVKDDNGVYTVSTDAAKAAKKNGKPVVVVATMGEVDLYSTDFINYVLNDPRFKDEIAQDYNVLHLDFSQSAYEATAVGPDATKEEIKIADKNAAIMQKNTLLASRLNLQDTPSIYLLSSDMYFIKQLDYLTDEVTNYDSFKNLLLKQEEDITLFNEKVMNAKNGSKEDRLVGINRLYDDTDIVYRAFLGDLIDDYISLDKNNETGLLSKYLIARADIDSSNYFMAGDIANAVKVYVKCAEDERIEAEYKQNLYYLASYMLASTNSIDYEAMINYLEKAINAYPEGPNVPMMETVLSRLKEAVGALDALDTE